jgi:hypothetical protein
MTDRFVFHPDKIDLLPESTMDDGNMREFLDDPEFSFRWDDDGYDADLILQAATDSGTVIESPTGKYLWWDFSHGGEHGPMYELRVTVALDDGRSLRLAGLSNDYPPTQKRGREAIIEFLSEAVETGNAILDSLAEYNAA